MAVCLVCQSRSQCPLLLGSLGEREGRVGDDTGSEVSSVRSRGFYESTPKLVSLMKLKLLNQTKFLLV